MPFRDIGISLAIFGSVPFILRDPYWGVLVWNWMAFMYPHRYAWDFARDFRFSLVIAVSTLLSFVLYKGARRIPWRAPVVLMICLVLWVTVTTFLAALNPVGARAEWERFVKIIVMVLVALALTNTQQRLQWLVWVVVLSLGFFGFKGGLFTIAHGGAYRVGGPVGSFIEGNNELAFALVMCLPLMRYLQLTSEDKRIRFGLTVLMVLCGFSIVGSYSRGAFLAGAVMALMLWFRSRRKLVLGLAMVLLIPMLLSFMPEEWTARMETIQTYKEDSSAMGRINAWYFAWNLAMDYPITGGGARVFTKELFWRYAPEPENHHDVHSIYFEMLAEQGFVGLGLFLAIGITAMAGASRLMRLGKTDPSLQWAYDLGSMVQVSIAGYSVGGAFLGLAYFDLPYTIVAFVVMAQEIAEHDRLKVLAAREDVPGLDDPSPAGKS